MKLTLQLQLLPTDEQKPVLLDTIERFNQAASFAARVGFEAGNRRQSSGEVGACHDKGATF